MGVIRDGGAGSTRFVHVLGRVLYSTATLDEM